MNGLTMTTLAPSETAENLAAYSRYQVYLLRVWQEGPDSPVRVHLLNAATGERRTFDSLTALFVFLQEREEAQNRQKKARG